MEFKSSLIGDEAGISKAVESVVSSEQDQLLIVVPGMGTTEQRLVEAGEKSASQDLVLASTLAEGARTFYMQVARQLTSESVWSETQNFLSTLFEEFTNLLQGVYLIGELTSQAQHVVQSYAERASAVVMAQALKERRVQAQPVCGREVYLANSSHVSKNFQEKAVSDFQREISTLSQDGSIPVIPASLRPLAVEK